MIQEGDDTAAEPPAPRVWCMTTGESGLRSQARGLARAISPAAEERLIRVSRLAALAPPALFGLGLFGIASVDGLLAPPWPQVLISCGRRSALAAVALRRRAATPMVLIHIQPPRFPSLFDLVVTMPHDRLQGPNVVQVDTALHGVCAADLRAASHKHDSRFAHLPRPWTGVLLGGATGHRPFSTDDASRLAQELDALRARRGGALLITPSRRTPASVVAALHARYRDDRSVFFWHGGMANPYLTILAQADRLVVTSDSISMLSEALATKAEVLVFSVPGGARHAHFVRNLMDRQWVAPLAGAAATPAPTRAPQDATPLIAQAVRDIVAARFGAPARERLPITAG